MILVVLATLAPSAADTGLAATKVTVGYRDIQYGEPGAPGGDDVTANGVQSKLWTHDGRWFGVLFDPVSTVNAKFRIWQMSMANQSWTNTGVAVDDRNRSHADVLKVGAKVYVASARAEGAAGTTGRDLRIYKYTYVAATKTYAAVDGYPKVIPATAVGTGYSTIAIDGTGRLWVAFTQSGKVRISSSANSGATWSAPIDLPTMGNDIAAGDVAAIAPLASGATKGVGVLWSNQSATDDAFYFSAHVDGAPVGTWQAREAAPLATPGTVTYTADGHISLKTDASGNLLAAVKTGRNDDPGPNGTDPLVVVFRRTGSPAAAGTWTSHTVTDVSTRGTRPILVLDGATDTANVFLTFPDLATSGHQSIHRRTAPLSTLNFGASALGPLFIKSATETAINDATSTKQVTVAGTGIIVKATNIPTREYFHNCAGTVCPKAPTAAFTADDTTGTAPHTVAFTDTSTNSPTAWAWNFGDGGTSTQRSPSHQYVEPGTYTVKLTASNVAGSDVETKTSYVTVTEPPETTYHAIAPVRALDSRTGTGLSGTFKAGVPRTLSIAGVNGIPADATAITGNLTVVSQSKGGYLSVTPNPVATAGTSNLNFPIGDVRANGITVPLNGSGDLSIVYGSSAGATTHVLLDITGYFRVATDGSTFFTKAPVRVLDTRFGTGLSGTFKAGVPRTLSIAGANGIPADATAITANLTVVGQSRAGRLSVTPNPVASPGTSTLNFPLGDVRANGITVPLNGSGDLSIVYGGAASGSTTHVLLDVTGYFRDGTSGATFVPVTPARILDTRFANGLNGTFKTGVPRTLPVIGRGGVSSSALAIVGNVTVVGQSKSGYVSLTPTPQVVPTVSTINFPVGDVRANNFALDLSGTGTLSGTYRAGAGATTHLIIDVSGFYK